MLRLPRLLAALRAVLIALGLGAFAFIVIDTHALPGMHVPTPFVESTTPGSLAPGMTAYPVPTDAVYVSPSGSDRASGSRRHPFATVAHALLHGHTVVLRKGTYEQSVVLPVGHAVTVQAYPGEPVWFDGDGRLSTAFDVRSTDSLLRGFGVRHYLGDAVVLAGKHSRLSNLDITGNSGRGVVVTGPSVRVDHLEAAQDGAVGLDVAGADDLRVYNSVLRDDGDGVRVERSAGFAINNSTIRHNRGDGIFLDSATRPVITSTHVLENGHDGVALTATTAAILVDDALAHNAAVGVRLLGSTDIRVWNDLLEDNARSNLASLGNDDQAQVINNVFLGTAVDVTVLSSKGVVIDGNLFCSPAHAEIAYGARTYATLAAFTSATGQGRSNQLSTGTTLATINPPAYVGGAIPLSSAIALVAGRRAGTRYLGPF